MMVSKYSVHQSRWGTHKLRIRRHHPSYTGVTHAKNGLLAEALTRKQSVNHLLSGIAFIAPIGIGKADLERLGQSLKKNLPVTNDAQPCVVGVGFFNDTSRHNLGEAPAAEGASSIVDRSRASGGLEGGVSAWEGVSAVNNVSIAPESLLENEAG